MDLLKEIRRLADRFPDGYKSQGVDAITLHIERAEKYWQQAKDTNDEELFTDVIYRTNQAFEGALKEAYLMLAEKDPTKKTPYEIEQYLEGGKFLKDRVLVSLRNYRKDWRNSSTHNYQLFFTEQEALLAIANVSTFSIILLEQINTKANENFEKERVKKFSSDVINSIQNYLNLSFEEKVYSLLTMSYEYIEYPNRVLMEYEYIGLLKGFVEAVDPSIEINSEVKFGTDTNLRADLVFSSDKGKAVLVEIKRNRLGLINSSFLLRSAEEQLSQYLITSGINNGVLMLYDSKATKGRIIAKDTTQQSLFDFGDMPNITYIMPVENSN